ncbi:DUF1905 domain-containing protein [Microbacterium sp. P05]|uniref:DUF1905 domain-containing protein n=1 Tax=Microbacterium sp. P05 TaxID=3366948 RepID=UPI003746715E
MAPDESGPPTLDFVGTIGVTVKGEVWSCVEVPGSAEHFRTSRAVKVAATVDGEPLAIALMPTGRGGHMLSITAQLRRRLGKEIGDTVVVHIEP